MACRTAVPQSYNLARNDILSLYKHLLKNAKVFPSIKRKVLYEDIRFEFRKNKALSDPATVSLELERAVRGYKQMRQFTALDKDASAWEVHMEEMPMPPPPGRRTVLSRDAEEAR